MALKVLKNPKGGPFYVKKIFVSYSAQISCMKSLGHKDLKSLVSSKSETKKAYRRMMSQHHPDKLVSKGLPEEMIKLATEKTQKIREAYDLIKSRNAK